jgi:DNA polymerase-1
MSDQKKKLFIVDISSFIFRAFFAIRPLHAPDGTPVNAVHGVLQMLLKLLSKYQSTHIVMAQDVAGGSFRNEMYPEYKANRSEPPEELIPQFSLIKELVTKLKLPAIGMKGFEADDVIGSLVVQHQNDFDEIYIVSGDKDLMQFVNEKVFMIDTMKEKLFGPEEVKEKMGVRPDQIVDYLSMLGDSSDNIPGMRGIGAKGAAKLLAEYETFDACIENMEKMTNKRVKNAFENFLDNGKLSRDLVRIVTDLELDSTVDSLEYSFDVGDELLKFLEDLGMMSSIKKLKELAYIDHVSTNSEVAEIDPGLKMAAPLEDIYEIHQKNAGWAMTQISSGKMASIVPIWDCEERFSRKVLAFAIADEFGQNYFLPLVESLLISDKQQIITNEQKIRVFEVLFSHKSLRTFLVDYSSWWFFNSTERIPENHNLTELALVEFLRDPGRKNDAKSVFKKLGYEGTIEFVFDLNDMGAGQAEMKREATGFASLLLARGKESWQKIVQSGQTEIYETLDRPLQPILSKMERQGVYLNKEFFYELEKEYSTSLEQIEKKISAFVPEGETVNLRSPKQVGKLLFETLELPVVKKTKTGFSTASDVLEELNATTDSEVPGLILKFRELDKLLSTYILTLPGLINESTGKLHTHFGLTTAATGRLASDRPNLQNIPIRTELGRKLRKGFMARPGCVLLAADYSQVELRILAHFSEDPVMMGSFKDGLDIHAQTASEVFQTPLKDVTSEQRSSAKAINFGLMYGQSSFGLSQQLKISRAEAKDYITMYFERFHQVKSFLDSLKEACEDTGYAQTLYGRRRALPDIHASNRTAKAMAERVAINSPIQGTAADIIKLAMLKVDQRIQELALESKLILQVHDELIFEVPENELDQMEQLVKDAMENAASLKVPLEVAMGIGVNWYDLK